MTTPVDRMVRIYTARMINAVTEYEDETVAYAAFVEFYKPHKDAEFMASTDSRAIAAAGRAARSRAAAAMYAAVVTALRADEPAVTVEYATRDEVHR